MTEKDRRVGDEQVNSAGEWRIRPGGWEPEKRIGGNKADLQTNPQEFVGCWYDGARGQYMGEAIQKAAQRYGWTGEFLNADQEFYHEAWEEAEAHLNGIAPDGFAFGTSEGGDFMFLPQHEWEN